MFFPNYIEYLRANWRLLSLPYGEDFPETFQLMHQAIQFLAMACKSVFPPRFDDSHTSFKWDYQQNCFATDWMHFKHTVRLELCPQSFTIRLVGYGNGTIDSFCLDKKTKMEVYGQLRQMLQDGGVKIDRFVNEMHYDLPDHEVCKGGRFSVRNDIYNIELGHQYANAYILLRRLAANSLEVSGIRCWPHHFDLTMNMPLTFKGFEKANNLILGFSPSNPDVPEPHFFIKLAESNNSIKISRKLKHSFFFREAKTGTFLPMGLLVEKKTINSQTEVLSNYLTESFDVFQEQIIG